MGDKTEIQWTKHTWNPWWGCTKVSPGCAHCYACKLSEAYNVARWGPGQPRKVQSEKVLRSPYRWNEAARQARGYATVFLGSMMDFFDEEAPAGMREHCLDVIEKTPRLIYLILTKRPEEALKLWGPDWNPPRNVWLGVSIESREYLWRAHTIMQVPATGYFVSAEPQLAYLNLTEVLQKNEQGRRINWLIVGGESGPGARPFMLDWLEGHLADCLRENVPLFVKQAGSHVVIGDAHERLRLRDSKGGDPKEWPHEYRVREFPEWFAPL